MARGGEGLTKVSPGPAMPNSSMPCRWATPEMALQAFQGWPACSADGLRRFPTRLDTPRGTPMRNCTIFIFKVSDSYRHSDSLVFLCQEFSVSQ
jgi:hypothetical protein